MVKEQKQNLACNKRKGNIYIGSIPLGSHDQICNALPNDATCKPN